MTFNQDKYKAIFEKRYGSGSYESGLSSARSIGKTKAQADFEKDEANRRIKEAERAYKEAIKEAEKAEKAEQKRRQEEAKLAARNEASERAPDLSQNEYYNKMNEAYSYGNQQRMEKERRERGVSASDLSEEINKEKLERSKKKKKDDAGLLGDIKKTAKTFGEFINPFDDVTMKEALSKESKRERSKSTDEVNRFASRTLNSASLGALEKGIRGKTDRFEDREFGSGGGIDFVSSGLGYLLPGTGAVKGAKSLGLGAKGMKGASTGKKAIQLAKEGSAAGALFGLAEGGATEVFSPDKRDWKDHALNIGLETAGGAVLDPLLTLGGSKLLSKIRKPKTNENSSVREVASNKDTPPDRPILGLPEPKTNSRFKYDSPTSRQSDEILGLPAPKTQRVISAKRTDDKYALKLAKLFEEANKSNMPPGREREFVEDLWSRMADPSDPDLDTLIDLATPSIERMKMNPAKMVSEARSEFNNPYGFDKYSRFKSKEEIVPVPKNEGTPLTFKRERYNPVINENVSYVGKNTNPVSQRVLGDLNINPKNNSIKVQSTPNAEIQSILQTLEEPRKTVASTKLVEPEYINSSPDPGLLKVKPILDFSMNNIDPVIPDTRKHLVSKTDTKLRSKINMDNFMITSVDDLHMLKQFDKVVENVTGTKLKPSESSYTLGLNSRGADQISKQILTNKAINSQGDVIGQSLKEVVSKIPKGKELDFEDYLVNRHAITRMERGEKVFPDDMKMSPEKSAVIVQEYEKNNPSFRQLAEQYYDYNRSVAKAWLVDTGIISPETWNGYLKANPNYVPNQRLFDELERPMHNGAKKGFANQSDPIKKATGSQRKIISPIESTIENTDKYVKTAKRNEVMQTLIKNITKNPEAFKGWAEIVPTDKTPQSVIKELQEEGIEGFLENFNKGFDQKPDLTHGNIVTGIIDGQKVHVRVQDPQLLNAITNLHPQAQGAVIETVGKLTRFMKTVTTGINPIFTFTRNIMRDIPTAYVNSKTTHNPVTFTKDFAHAVLDIATNGELTKQFKALGGGHSSAVSTDINLLEQSKNELLKRKPSVASVKGVKSRVNQGIGFIENINNLVEMAPRLAEFKRASKNGDYDSKIKGIFEANDVTTNFNKRGTVARQADAFIPYLNAAIQGLNKTKRSITDQPLAFTVKGVTALSVPTMVLYAINHDNPKYHEVSRHIKDNFFLIPNPTDGGETFIKIAKPREYGVMFSTPLERAMNQLENDDPEAFKGFAKHIVTNYLPPTNSVFKPFQDIRANKNFMDSPIVPGDLARLSPENQWDSRTSEPAKLLGKVFNQSPKHIDYLASQYGGILSDLGIPLTTKDGGIGEMLKRQVTADPVFNNDALNDFYEKKEKLDTAEADFKATGKSSKDLNDELRKSYGRTSRDISDLRKEMKSILNDESLSKEERKERVREIQIEINNFARTYK